MKTTIYLHVTIRMRVHDTCRKEHVVMTCPSHLQVGGHNYLKSNPYAIVYSVNVNYNLYMYLYTYTYTYDFEAD